MFYGIFFGTLIYLILLLLLSLFLKKVSPFVAVFFDPDHHELFLHVNILALKILLNLQVIKSPSNCLSLLLTVLDHVFYSDEILRFDNLNLKIDYQIN
jgi:hypothetical protein